MKYLLTAVFILYVVFLSFFSRGDFPSNNNEKFYFPYLAERPIIEDGFYSLKIAWNIGNGKGITYNLDQPTTGFQPLYVFLLSILAFANSTFGGDKVSFLRLVLLSSGLFALLLSYLFYLFVIKLDKKTDRKILFIVVALLVLFNFKLFLNLFNGLETGLYLVFLVLSIIQTYDLAVSNKNSKQILLLGLTFGLTVLARNDFVLIVIVVLLTLLKTKRINFKDLIKISTILILTVLPWFIYIFSIQGGIIPTSVSVQTGSSDNALSYKFDQFVYSILGNYIPFIHAGQTQTIFIYLITVAFIFYLLKYEKLYLKKFFGISSIKYWMAAILTISIVYLLFASQPYFYFRYLSIHMLIAIPFLALLITRKFENRSLIMKNIFVLLVVGIFFVNVGYYFHYPKKVSGLSLRTSFIKEKKISDEKIGMAQSGISGYFFDNVINLDGKVNFEALKAIQNNRLYNYIVNEKIKILIEWKEWFQKQSLGLPDENWVLYGNELEYGKSLVFVKRDYLIKK